MTNIQKLSAVSYYAKRVLFFIKKFSFKEVLIKKCIEKIGGNFIIKDFELTHLLYR